MRKIFILIALLSISVSANAQEQAKDAPPLVARIASSWNIGWVSSPPSATQGVTFVLTFNFTDSAQRSAVLLDYAKARSLDIYTRDAQGNPTATVDASKVGPAVTADVKQQLKAIVVDYRASLQADAAAAAARSSEGAAINP